MLTKSVTPGVLHHAACSGGGAAGEAQRRGGVARDWVAVHVAHVGATRGPGSRGEGYLATTPPGTYSHNLVARLFVF